MNTHGFSEEKVLLKSTPPAPSASGSASMKRERFPRALAPLGVVHVSVAEVVALQVVVVEEVASVHDSAKEVVSLHEPLGEGVPSVHVTTPSPSAHPSSLRASERRSLHHAH